MVRVDFLVVLVIGAVCRLNVHSMQFCHEDEFACRDGSCIPKGYVCDSSRDCPDNSDEQDCHLICTLDVRKFYCIEDKTCIDLDNVCNYESDCSDESDEDGCWDYDENCDSMQCLDGSTCQNLPGGAKCLCSKGFEYNSERDSCEDITGCETFGVCSQGCVNTQGSYICTCSENYELKDDNTTCVAKFGEPLLVYTTGQSVVGIFLKLKHRYTIADHLLEATGVANDGHYIYWTSINLEDPSIVKILENGTNQETLLTFGLDTPENLAVDWLTGNIYFSDSALSHIAVCSNDGYYCTPLEVVDVHQPRGIALWPQMALMYWTNWGKKPMIARASMDGAFPVTVVTSDIYWPNGIALDIHNDRFYWVDAKLKRIESARMDGSDRRLILSDYIEHPYDIALFENNLYWSDWETKSIHACNKFTGKDHEVIVEDGMIYGVHVYHSANQPKVKHACENRGCTHLCLLAANNSSTCACPNGMFLATDETQCVESIKKQILYAGVKNIVLEMERSTFGRHKVLQEHSLPIIIDQMAYNSINGTILIADNYQKVIAEYDPSNKIIKTLLRGSLGNVTGMAFDHLAHNLYWTDSERNVVEVYSLRKGQRAIVYHLSGEDMPIGIGLRPENGTMSLVVRSSNNIRIDQRTLDGSVDYHYDDVSEMAAIGIMHKDSNLTLFWIDTEGGRIKFPILYHPVSVAFVYDQVYWSTLHSPYLYWAQKDEFSEDDIRFVKKHRLEISNFKMVDKIQLLSSHQKIELDHPCLHNNAECSHVCVISRKNSATCLCPSGLVFTNAKNKTCFDPSQCEFRCKSGECLTNTMRCNGHKDCPDGSDEELCDPKTRKTRNMCALNEFMCHDTTQCIPNELQCNQVKECRDGSDEEYCKTFDCPKGMHKCELGRCIGEQFVCDGHSDCRDNSDELSCRDKMQKFLCGDDDNKLDNFNKPKKFQCPSEPTICLDWKAKCNGTSECPRGEDEIGCHGSNVSIYTYIYVSQTIIR